MSEYKSLKDWFGDSVRGDGRKFTDATSNTGWYFEPVYKTSVGYWHGLDCDGLTFKAGQFEKEWRLWTEPKKTKKVTMYRPVFKDYIESGTQHFCTDIEDEWHTDKSNWDDLNIVGWLSQEVEVEE